MRVINSFRGKNAETDEYSAGRLTVELLNESRQYDPEHSSGPHYGELVPGKRIRVTCTYSSTTYNLWQGFVQSWEQGYDLSDSAVFARIQAVDPLGFFSRLLLPGDYFGEVVASHNPLYWFRFAEKVGTIAADETGTLDATYSDSIETRSTESLVEGLKSDSAIDFSGNLNVRLAPEASGPRSLEFLLKLSEYPTDYAFLFDTPPNRSYAYIDPDGHLHAKFQDSSTLTSTTRFRLDTPYHVFIGDYSDESTGINLSEAAIFVNGVNEASTSYVTGTGLITSEVSSEVLILGAHLSSLSYHFTGIIDECVLYSISDCPKPSEILEHYNALFQPLEGQLSGERIDTVLDLVGWPVGDRDIADGQQTVRPANFEISALNYCQKIAQAEQGQFHSSADGRLVFRDRSYRTTNASSSSSQATFGDSGAELRYSDIQVDNSNKQMLNTVRVSRVGGTTYTAQDATSVGNYGEISREITDLEITDDNVVRGIADWLVEFNKDPQTRLTALTFLPRRSVSTLLPQSLTRDIGDRVTVRRRPGGVGSAIDKDVFIEGIGHTITKTDGDWNWKTTFNFSPAQDLSDYWILGTSTFDSETVLAYP